MGEGNPLERELFKGPLAAAPAFTEVILLDAVATITVEVSSLFLHHLPHSSLQFFGAVKRSAAVLALAWLFVDKVTVGAGKLKLGVNWADSSILESWFKFQLHYCCFSDDKETVPDVLLHVQEGKKILDKDIQLIRITPFDIHLLLLSC